MPDSESALRYYATPTEPALLPSSQWFDAGHTQVNQLHVRYRYLDADEATWRGPRVNNRPAELEFYPCPNDVLPFPPD